MSLAERLARRIARSGPLGVADYMVACLHDPGGGYYATRPRLGEGGDFITAPHVSQMFGELLGLWAVEVWMRLGRPPRPRLAELGPGDGTLMSDALRAAGKASSGATGFLGGLEVILVETSAPLRRRQEAALAQVPVPVRWVECVEDLPDDGPIVMLANEFLDCLPIDQAVRGEGGWAERRVGLNAAGGLAFQAAGPIRRLAVDGPAGAVAEWSDALEATGRAVGSLLARAGGAGLFIDYGRDGPGLGDTLQALRGHVREGPLEHPGEADLTAHVDFPAFLAAGEAGGARAAPLRSQRALLRVLGIEVRAAALAHATPARADLVERQLHRLLAPEQMGDLFKAACLHSPGLVPPGFEAP